MDVNKIEFAGEEEFILKYEKNKRAHGTPLHYAAAWGWNMTVEKIVKTWGEV